MYSDGTDDEKTLIYDLADYFTDYDEQGEMFHRDIDDIVSVESVAYTDVLKMKKIRYLLRQLSLQTKRAFIK